MSLSCLVLYSGYNYKIKISTDNGQVELWKVLEEIENLADTTQPSLRQLFDPDYYLVFEVGMETKLKQCLYT